MKGYFLGIIVFFLSFCCITCKEDENGGKNTVPAETKTLKIDGINDQSWTYISFESGKVIGSSELGNAAEDSAWATRKDWDMAICGDMLRTNSGTSGEGNGGIISINDKSFNAIDQAPAEGYIQDNNNVIIKH